VRILATRTAHQLIAGSLLAPVETVPSGYTTVMLILGIVLLVLGLLFHIPVLWMIGIVLAVVGAVLMLVPGDRRRIY
jgi:membrane protein implicated in regulation of membrane protease activity